MKHLLKLKGFFFLDQEKSKEFFKDFKELMIKYCTVYGYDADVFTTEHHLPQNKVYDYECGQVYKLSDGNYWMIIDTKSNGMLTGLVFSADDIMRIKNNPLYVRQLITLPVLSCVCIKDNLTDDQVLIYARDASVLESETEEQRRPTFPNYGKQPKSLTECVKLNQHMVLHDSVSEDIVSAAILEFTFRKHYLRDRMMHYNVIIRDEEGRFVI